MVVKLFPFYIFTISKSRIKLLLKDDNLFQNIFIIIIIIFNIYIILFNNNILYFNLIILMIIRLKYNNYS